ncbi:CinA family nicotinamide mononucleotide deamidase-related protein [Desulfopila inferna]|uniref:CinA family nicotinamide mononucleotide deamidase-related protein n=1 Tax=Desulfopila inferna TaxID=468528 RepID=UPI00196554C5|nr:CinA family nicotinamide mononucleotide deamidase-related protein [Desulfopila inferna]MBM9603235.1 CinA family nicotinamide mononucleotide deamidase-related protein [Desulfopila inferna]
MKGEIIAIGDELTSGRILNTTSGFAARHLFDAGYEIYAMHTIGDTPVLIGEALKRALDRVDFVIVTGGLGITDDDLTNEAVSIALNIPTMPNLEILYQIRSHLDGISGNPLSPLEKLAWLPKGAEALNPKARMAGYQLVHDGKPIFFLPGIPSQMEQLLLEQVLPRLTTWYADPRKGMRQKMLRVFNMNEVEVNGKIASLKLDKTVSIGYYPVFPELHISLTIRNTECSECTAVLSHAADSICDLLGSVVYGKNQETMEAVVGKLLKKKKLKLAVAESCTGGLLSHKITKVPGSSSYYLGGITTYANSMKTKFLHVPKKMLNQHGAVSREVAETMAASVRKITGADLSLSITGIAGPEGGSEEKPVGTVYIGMAGSSYCSASRFQFEGSREQIQEITAVMGLDQVRRYLLNQL